MELDAAALFTSAQSSPFPQRFLRLTYLGVPAFSFVSFCTFPSPSPEVKQAKCCSCNREDLPCAPPESPGSCSETTTAKIERRVPSCAVFFVTEHPVLIQPKTGSSNPKGPVVLHEVYRARLAHNHRLEQEQQQKCKRATSHQGRNQRAARALVRGSTHGIGRVAFVANAWRIRSVAAL
jgi:hypothetical protein